MLKLFILAALVAAPILWLPARYLAIWLALFWGGNVVFWNSLDFTDDPALLSASFVCLPFWLMAGAATIGRLGLIMVRAYDAATRGYRG